MIQKAMSFIAAELNGYIRKRNQFASTERMVVISNLMNADGSAALKEENKLVLSLVNIQKETTINLSPVNGRNPGSRTAQPHFYNIYLLVSAYFKENLAEEGLRYLSQVLTFFQSNPSSDRTTNSNMPPEISKLTYDFFPLQFSDMSHLWGALGAKYMPSALFKVGLVMVQEGLIKDAPPVISKFPEPEEDGGLQAQ
jgi:hypothetical protein